MPCFSYAALGCGGWIQTNVPGSKARCPIAGRHRNYGPAGGSRTRKSLLLRQMPMPIRLPPGNPWWRWEESNLRCVPVWVAALQAAAVASEPHRHIGGCGGIRTRKHMVLNHADMPKFSTHPEMVGLLGFEPRKCPLLRRMHMPCSATGPNWRRVRDLNP